MLEPNFSNKLCLFILCMCLALTFINLHTYFLLSHWSGHRQMYCNTIIDSRKTQTAIGKRGTFPDQNVEVNLPWLVIITPTTAKRIAQKADLTRLSQTLQTIPKLHWIVIEDNVIKTSKVQRLLKRSNLPYTHLAIHEKAKGRGMPQRNLGLQWIRKEMSIENGVVYFADDDNAYDRRLFEKIRHVKKVGINPVGFCGKTMVESPIVAENGTIVDWDVQIRKRKFAVDMAGFSVNLDLIRTGNATFDVERCKAGRFETCFVEQLGVELDDLEPIGMEAEHGSSLPEVLAWHTKTVEPNKKKFHQPQINRFEI